MPKASPSVHLRFRHSALGIDVKGSGHVPTETGVLVLREARRGGRQALAGPRVFICDECVAVASRLMHEADTSMPNAERTTPKPKRSFTLRFWHWAVGIRH
jgi:hypothetical protein